MESKKPRTVDEYIAGFPEDVQKILEQMRETIKKLAPEVEESIGYAMPAYKLAGKPLVYFAGYKGHIGFYATPTGHSEFEAELSSYKQGKGSVQFPLDSPFPLDLVRRIVEFRVKENLEKPKTTRSAKKTALSNDTHTYNNSLSVDDKSICDLLAAEISRHLPEAENKIWHRHPVWFLEGNPIVGYSKLKNSVRLLFWSGQSFDEEGLEPEGSFKAAEARFTAVNQVSKSDLQRWLEKSRETQWDYKNIIKRKGKLERLK